MSRVGVAVELWSESARPLIRTAAAFAKSTNASWTAIAVTDPLHGLSRLTNDQRQLVSENTNLITWLGGTPFFCDGDDIAETLLAAAKLAGVDILILGKPRDRGILPRIFGDHISTSVLRGAANMLLMFAAYPDANGTSR
jgi:K+-sensing histidine kinase KdpD